MKHYSDNQNWYKIDKQYEEKLNKISQDKSDKIKIQNDRCLGINIMS